MSDSKRPTDEEFLAIFVRCDGPIWTDEVQDAEVIRFARTIYRMGQEEMRERAAELVYAIASDEDGRVDSVVAMHAISALEVE